MPSLNTYFKKLRNIRGFEKSGIMLFSVGSRALGQLLLNKLVAIFAGPAGIAFLSQFHNLLGGLLIVPAEGVNRAMVALLPSANEVQKHKIRYAGFLWNVLIVAIEVALIYVLLPHLSFADADRGLKPNPWVLSALVAMHVFLLFQLNHFIIQADIKRYAAFISVGQFLGVILASVGWWLDRLDWIIYLFFCGQALPNGAAWLYAWLKHHQLSLHYIWPVKYFSSKAFNQVGPYMLIAVVSLTAGKLTDQYAMVRCHKLLGTGQLGLWQALVRISDLLIIPYATIMSGLAYPWLAKNLSQPAEVRRMVRRWLALLTLGGIVGFWLYKWILPLLIRVVHSRNFLDALQYADYQILGDMLRLPAYLLGYLLLARQHTWTYLLFELLSAAIYVLLLMLLPTHLDAGYFTMAYGIRMGIYLLAMVWVNKSYLTSS